MANDEGMWWGKDGGRYKSIWDKNAADTRYEQNQKQINELAETNRLERARQENERINAEKLAEATREAEEDRYEHEIQLERERQTYNDSFEIQRQVYEERMRLLRLCDDAGVDYNEIFNFLSVFELAENYRQKQHNRLEFLHQEKEKRQEIIEDSKKDLKIKKNIDEQSVKVPILNMVDTLQLIDKRNAEYIPRFRIEFGEEFKTDPLNPPMEKVSKFTDNQKVVIILWIIELVIHFILISSIKNDISFYISLFLFIMYLIYCYFNSRFRQETLDKKREKQIDEITSQYNSEDDEIIKNIMDDICIVKSIEKHIKDIEVEMEKDEKMLNELTNKVYSEFLEFRINNYNEKIETLFKQIGASNLKKLDVSNEFYEKIIKDGTINGYLKFIRKVNSMIDKKINEGDELGLALKIAL